MFRPNGLKRLRGAVTADLIYVSYGLRRKHCRIMDHKKSRASLVAKLNYTNVHGYLHSFGAPFGYFQ